MNQLAARLSLAVAFGIAPAIVVTLFLAAIEHAEWTSRGPKRWWFYAGAFGTGLVIGIAIIALPESMGLDTLVVWPAVLVSADALWLVAFAAKRSFDPFFGALGVWLGSDAAVFASTQLSGGDDSGMWTSGFFLSMCLIGAPLFLVAVIQQIALGRKRRTTW